jgi:hypothetical protein
MAFIEDISKGSVATILVGIGVAVVAPTILPALASGLRPLAKAVIKGGVIIYDAVKETVAEAGEQLSDLVAEAKAELAESTTDESASAAVSTEGQKKAPEEEKSSHG